MTPEQVVRNRFSVVHMHQRLSDREYEVWVNNYTLGNVYPTEQEAWENAAKWVEYWKVDRRQEIMDNLVKQLTGYDNKNSRT